MIAHRTRARGQRCSSDCRAPTDSTEQPGCSSLCFPVCPLCFFYLYKSSQIGLLFSVGKLHNSQDSVYPDGQTAASSNELLLLPCQHRPRIPQPCFSCIFLSPAPPFPRHIPLSLVVCRHGPGPASSSGTQLEQQQVQRRGQR